MNAALNTEEIVAILKSAGLQAEIDTRRTKRSGFRVRKMSLVQVGLDGTSMTPGEWAQAMNALTAAGLTFHYRSDEGRGCSVRR